MTTLCTALALLPLVVPGSIPGHEIEHPMAVVILGGLVTSTLLTLFVVPILYLRYGARRKRSEPTSLRLPQPRPERCAALPPPLATRSTPIHGCRERMRFLLQLLSAIGLFQRVADRAAGRGSRAGPHPRSDHQGRNGSIAVKTTDGKTVRLALADGITVISLTKGNFSDLDFGTYVGSVAVRLDEYSPIIRDSAVLAAQRLRASHHRRKAAWHRARPQEVGPDALRPSSPTAGSTTSKTACSRSSGGPPTMTRPTSKCRATRPCSRCRWET